VAVPLAEHYSTRRRTFTMPAIKHPVKINVDLGEGYGNFKCGPDEELIPIIDHANVACGFHAGYTFQEIC
jgi:hypothetical protein